MLKWQVLDSPKLSATPIQSTVINIPQNRLIGVNDQSQESDR